MSKERKIENSPLRSSQATRKLVQHIGSWYGTWQLYQFPEVSVTNYYKFGGLKQQKFILTQFQRTKVQNPVGLYSLWEVQERIFPCLFQLLVSAPASPGLGCIATIPVSIFTSSSPLYVCVFCCCCSLIRTFEMAFRAHPDNPG